MNESTINRRNFIRTTGFGILEFPLYTQALPKVAPSDNLRVVHIGTGNMGKSHIHWFSAFPDVETIALYDVDKLRLADARKLLLSHNASATPEVYSDFRYILERKKTGGTKGLGLPPNENPLPVAGWIIITYVAVSATNFLE